MSQKNTPESFQIEMVPIVGDTFTMGGTAKLYADHYYDRISCWADDLTPIREVTVPDFEISRYPITVGQYRKAVECGACNPPQEGWSEAPGEDEDRPIRGILVRDAEQFAAFLGCRLLSEVEWEYAIAGPHLRHYAWGWSRPDYSTLIGAEIDSESDGQALLQQYSKEQLLQTNLTKRAAEITGPGEDDCTPEGVCHFYLSFELVADNWSCCYCNGYDLKRYGIPLDEKPYRISRDTERVLRCDALNRRPIRLENGTGFIFRIARSCALGSEERKALQEKRDRGEERDRMRFEAQRERLREMYSQYLKARDGERPLEEREAFGREIGLEFVALPAGRFYAGELKSSDEAEPEDGDFVKEMPAFEIGKYPVTVGQMREAVRRGYCPHPSTDVEKTNYTEEPGESDRHPVKCSLQVARAFAKAVGGRLPCDSEWLYAARGVEGRLFPWGDDEPTDAHANFGSPARRGEARLTDVDAHPLGATPEGVFDMAGNMCEMTELDQRSDDLLGEQKAPLHGGEGSSGVGQIANDLCCPLHEPAGFRVVRAAKHPKTDLREPKKPADLWPIIEQIKERKKQEEREREAAEQAQMAEAPSNRALRERAKALGIEFVVIPGGSFEMGSDDVAEESPKHRVEMESFEMSVTPVTIGQVRQAVLNGWCKKPSHSFCQELYNIEAKSSNEDAPASIPWGDARAVAAGLGARLPTEAEWEYAARGQEGRIYPWGNEAPDEERAHFKSGPWITYQSVWAHPKGATPEGVQDMAGNCSEWVLDSWSENHEGAPTVGDRIVVTQGFDHVSKGSNHYDGKARLHASSRSSGCGCAVRLVRVHFKEE